MKGRSVVAVNAGFLLFAISAVISLGLLRQVMLQPNDHQKLGKFAMVVSLPAISSLILILIAPILRMIPENRISFPVNVTFPIIHGLLTLLLLKLVLTMPNAIEIIPARLSGAGVWENWSVLGASMAIQILVLTTVVALNRARVSAR